MLTSAQIYIMVAQRDSRISIEIAAAAKRDSSIVTALAVLTMVFLPATFVTVRFVLYHNFESVYTDENKVLVWYELLQF